MRISTSRMIQLPPPRRNDASPPERINGLASKRISTTPSEVEQALTLDPGIIYLFFEAFPISFGEARGWSLGISSLPFVSLIVGIFAGCISIAIVTKTRFARKLREEGKIIPEERLPPMIAGGIILPVGLFWWAWTSNPDISPWPQIIAGVPIGFGIILITLQGMNYIIDSYTMLANSALAAMTLV